MALFIFFKNKFILFSITIDILILLLGGSRL